MRAAACTCRDRNGEASRASHAANVADDKPHDSTDAGGERQCHIRVARHCKRTGDRYRCQADRDRSRANRRDSNRKRMDAHAYSYADGRAALWRRNAVAAARADHRYQRGPADAAGKVTGRGRDPGV